MCVKDLEAVMAQDPFAMLAHVVRNDITCAVYLMRKNETAKAIERLGSTLNSLRLMMEEHRGSLAVRAPGIGDEE